MQSARRVLQQAAREGWAVGAFNAANIETLKAIFGAAQKLEAPVIIESSGGETEYVGPVAFRQLIETYRQMYGVQAYINLDHSTDTEDAELGIDAGYELIHFDGGKFDFEENIKLTSKIVRKAHRHHLLVEGEIDHITGSSDDHRGKSVSSAQEEGNYTDPLQAREFVQRTKIDTLAVFIGNVHGIYKDPPNLDLELLEDIHDHVDAFLSLHGGSGIRNADVKKAIASGIVKVNVNSELRIAFLESLQQAVKKPKEIAAYKFMPPVIGAVQKVVEKKIKLFGSAGKTKRTWIKRMIV